MTETVYIYFFDVSSLTWNENDVGMPVCTAEQQEPVKTFLEVLPVEAQERLKRITGGVNRSMALISQVLQRYVFLDVYYPLRIARNGPNMKDIVIKTTMTGRRYWDTAATGVDEAVPYDYNVSHHDGIVVVAVRKGERVGVDVAVESDFSGQNWEDIFSKSELDAVKNGTTTYSQLWSLKESFVKASGLGISQIFEGLEFINVQSKKVIPSQSSQDYTIEVDFNSSYYPRLKQKNLLTMDRFISVGLTNHRILSVCVPNGNTVKFEFKYPTISDITSFITE
jgi:phosphopantetheinyl transferase